jgi:DNA replication protein DnaC
VLELVAGLWDGLCPTCRDRREREAMERWRADTAAGLDGLVLERARAAGFQYAECEATLDGVPVPLRKRLPGAAVKALVAGAPLEGPGFGLVGGQGVGKSMCLAAILKARLAAVLRATLAAVTVVPMEHERPWWLVPVFTWVNWPDAAATLKAHSMAVHGAQAVEELTQRWTVTPVLALDDLGRERLTKAGYDEDFAVGVLDRVVDLRTRARRPILWTSNLPPDGVARRYGAALNSRLLGAAPAVPVGDLPDLRLTPGA